MCSGIEFYIKVFTCGIEDDYWYPFELGTVDEATMSHVQ